MVRNMMELFSLFVISYYFLQTDAKSLKMSTVLEEQTSEKVDTCEQVHAWEQFMEAQTIDGQTVKVLQDSHTGPQLFYTVRCDSNCEGSPCKGIQRGIRSRCETRYNMVAAVIGDLDKPDSMRWEMIKVPGQCVCTAIVNSTRRVLL